MKGRCANSFGMMHVPPKGTLKLMSGHPWACYEKVAIVCLGFRAKSKFTNEDTTPVGFEPTLSKRNR